MATAAHDQATIAFTPPASDGGAPITSYVTTAGGGKLPFTLPMGAFVAAAQRELSIACGIEIEPERFVFRGLHVVARENSFEQLGFAVHTVDLHADEVRHAFEHNGDGLVRVRSDRVYSSELPLNRLLLVREDWLRENCFEVRPTADDLTLGS